MSAATTLPASGRQRTTEREELDWHVSMIVDLSRRIVARNDELEGQVRKLGAQLDDACDGLFEVQNAVRAKDEVIAELQAMLARAQR